MSSLDKGLYHAPQILTVSLSPSPPHKRPMTFTRVTTDTGSELTLIPGDPKVPGVP